MHNLYYIYASNDFKELNDFFLAYVFPRLTSAVTLLVFKLDGCFLAEFTPRLTSAVTLLVFEFNDCFLADVIPRLASAVILLVLRTCGLISILGRQVTRVMYFWI